LLEKINKIILLPMLPKIQKVFKMFKKKYIKKFIFGGFLFFLIKGFIWIGALTIAWFGFFS